MTSKELVDSLLASRPVERVGAYDHGPWHDTLKRWVKEGYPTEKSASGEERPVFYVDHFHYDMYPVGGWFDIMPIRGAREVVEETDEWISVRNGAGMVLRNWKHQSSTPEYVDVRMTSREIWERDYRHHLLGVDRQRLNIEQTRQQLERKRKEGYWTFYGHQFIWENMRGSMGNYCMLESMLLDPEWIKDYNRVYTDFYKAHFKIMLEEAGRPDGIWIYEDLGYRNGLVCSPKTLEELIFPYYKELVDFFHSYGLPVILHSDGRIDEALPLIIDAGFAAVNPMEVKAGCDSFKYAEQYGDRLAFIGGFDGRIMETGDRDLIRREVIKLVEGMKSRGARFMFGIDHSVSAAVSYADFRYALEVYREHSA